MLDIPSRRSSLGILGTVVQEMGKDPTERAVETLLRQIGEDPSREGLVNTPHRFAKMLKEMTSGYQTDLVELVNGAIFESDCSEMIIVRNIDFYSFCEHHILPFFGQVHVAYLPDGKVIGLSKIPRIVEMFSRRLQIQEQMTTQIADTVYEVLRPHGVGVIVEGVHLCSVMRGVRSQNAEMQTSALRGSFLSDPGVKEEFFSLVLR